MKNIELVAYYQAQVLVGSHHTHDILDIYEFDVLKITGFVGWASSFTSIFSAEKVFDVSLCFLMIYCPAHCATVVYFPT